MTGAALANARDPWWIIASAAAAMHGVQPSGVGDVDVLMSVRDARELLPTLGLEAAPGVASPRFRSAVFGQWMGPPLPVEIMADFSIRHGEDWVMVAPVTRQRIDLGDTRLFVPERGELAAMLRSFGRPKDLARAELLE